MAALPSHTSFTRMEKALQRSRLPSRCARACLRAAHAPASARRKRLLRRRPQAIALRKGTSKKRRQRVWAAGSTCVECTRKKHVSPAGSTSTKRNLQRVTPAMLLQPTGGTRSTFTSCGPHPPYTFTSCGLRPPYCCFVPAVPAALRCPAAADTRRMLLPLAGCGKISIQQYMNL